MGRLQSVAIFATAVLVVGVAAVGFQWTYQPLPTTAVAEQWGVLARVQDARSLQLLEQAARNGSVVAQRVLGTVLVNEDRVVTLQEGRGWLEKAAASQDAKAQLALGKLLFKGAPGITTDYTLARTALRAAVQGGEMGAAYYLGLIYKGGGDGIAANARIAANWFQTAATADVANAQFILGQMLLVGDGVMVDPVAARSWFEKAGEQDHPEANLQLLMARTRGEMGFDRDDVATARQSMEAQHSLRLRPPEP